MESVLFVEQRTSPWLVGQSIETENASPAAHESQKIASLSLLHADGRVAAFNASKLECVYSVSIFSRYCIGWVRNVSVDGMMLFIVR